MDEITKNTKLSSCLVGFNSRPPELPVDLWFQVFARLPIQHLLKCMFVSKFWCSIIRQPEFIQAYCSRNPFSLLLCTSQANHTRMDGACGRGAILSEMEGTCEVSLSRSLYWSNMLTSGHQEFFNLFNFSMFDTKGFLFPGCYGATQIINGFFCAYMGNHVSLVNVFAGQVTDLPCPPIRPNAVAHYYFGLESITGLYKLLCIDYSNFAFSRKQRGQGLRPEGTLHDFYILTISGSDQEFSWRRLQLPEQDDDQFIILRMSFSVNGALHWFRPRRDSICYFDLTKEEFGYIDANVREILRGDEISLETCLVQFRGKLSLFYCKGRSMIIRSLETDKSWTVHETTLPEEFRNPARIRVGSLSAGILLAYPEIEKSITQVYAYDNKNKFERFIVGKFPQSADLAGLSHLCCMEQKSEMLEALFRRFSPKY